MSYAVAAALQKAVFAVLAGDPALAALVGTAVFDAAPAGPMPGLCVTLGPEEVRDRSDGSGAGAIHRFTVSVVSQDQDFAKAKAVAGAVTDALSGTLPALERGRVVGLRFEKASARRSGTGGRVRRIDLRFRARVEDN